MDSLGKSGFIGYDWIRTSLHKAVFLYPRMMMKERLVSRKIALSCRGKKQDWMPSQLQDSYFLVLKCAKNPHNSTHIKNYLIRPKETMVTWVSNKTRIKKRYYLSFKTPLFCWKKVQNRKNCDVESSTLAFKAYLLEKTKPVRSNHVDSALRVFNQMHLDTSSADAIDELVLSSFYFPMRARALALTFTCRYKRRDDQWCNLSFKQWLTEDSVLVLTNTCVTSVKSVRLRLKEGASTIFTMVPFAAQNAR